MRWEISEGDIKFLYVMILVPPKDLGSIVLFGTWHYSRKVPALGMKVLALFIDKQVARTNHKHALIFLKSMKMSIEFTVLMN